MKKGKFILIIAVFSVILVGVGLYFHFQEENKPLTPEEKDKQTCDNGIQKIYSLNEMYKDYIVDCEVDSDIATIVFTKVDEKYTFIYNGTKDEITPLDTIIYE